MKKEIKRLEELRKKIIEWADEKGILKKATPEKQFLKFMEETGELARAILKQDSDEFIDAVGDVFVTIVIHAELTRTEVDLYHRKSWEILDNSINRNNELLISSMTQSVHDYNSKGYEWAINKLWFIHEDNQKELGVKENFEHCVETAYNVIAKRTGRMENGTFIKDEN